MPIFGTIIWFIVNTYTSIQGSLFFGSVFTMPLVHKHTHAHTNTYTCICSYFTVRLNASVCMCAIFKSNEVSN